LREKLKKQRLKEIQDFQVQQMSEKKHVFHMAKAHEKLLSKDIISKDLSNMKSMDKIERELKIKKMTAVKEMLDEQLRQDLVVKQSKFGLDTKEYALNAAKIRSVIDKYE
jgi:hypothetical protein